MLTEVMILIVLIVVNAFFAASEIALISLNDNKIKIMADEGHKKAKMLQVLLSEPSRFLATIQIGITLAGFLASAFAAESFAGRFSELIKLTGIAMPDSWLNNISVILITLVLSYFTLVFGELVPKRLAMKKAEPIAMFVARPLQILSAVTSPFVRLLTMSMNFIVRLFGIDPNEKDGHVTEEEIRMMVDVGEEKGSIHQSEKLFINNIFEFNNKTVSEIMTHRTDISALPIDTRFEDVIAFVNREKYSRVPIYENNIDNIIGIMHTKYLIQYVTQPNIQENFKLREILRTPYFVPGFKRTDELLRELQLHKIHLAVIIDEYGGTSGIVTLEDLLEEIVGNIFDEDDEVEHEIIQVDERTYQVLGTTSLDDVGEYFRIQLPTAQYETLSGFFIGKLGRMPRLDEHATVEVHGLILAVEEADEKTVTRFKVTTS
jgi:putative hemolysin